MTLYRRYADGIAAMRAAAGAIASAVPDGTRLTRPRRGYFLSLELPNGRLGALVHSLQGTSQMTPLPSLLLHDRGTPGLLQPHGVD